MFSMVGQIKSSVLIVKTPGIYWATVWLVIFDCCFEIEHLALQANLELYLDEDD